MAHRPTKYARGAAFTVTPLGGTFALAADQPQSLSVIGTLARRGPCRIFAHALPRLRARSEAQSSQLRSPGGCRGVAMNSGFTVRAGDCPCPADRPSSSSADSLSRPGFPSPAGWMLSLRMSPNRVRAAHGPPRIKCGLARSRRHGFRTVLVQVPGRAMLPACPLCPDPGVSGGVAGS